MEEGDKRGGSKEEEDKEDKGIKYTLAITTESEMDFNKQT